jgi:hypothetical protein
MSISMLILAIALVSVFNDLSSAFSRYGNTTAAAEDSEPSPSFTPVPEMKSNLRQL